MPQKITYTAQPRTILGKKAKLIRAQKQLPANISGNVDKPTPVTVNTASFAKLYDKVGDTGLFYLKVEGETADRPVLVDDVQHDPVSGHVLHVTFRQVSLSEKVSAEVPVELVGEFGLKDAVVVTVHSEIEVEALPQDLPEKFVIDVAQFTEVGQSITFNQLDYDKSKVHLEVEEDQLDTPVVMVQAVKEEVEEVPVVEEVVGGEVPAAGGEETAPAAETAAEDKKE